MSTQNYYEILKSTPTASFEELRRNYKQLILQCHPDKLQHDSTNSISTTTTTTTHFDKTVSVANDAASTSTATVDPNAGIPTAMYSDQYSREFVVINEAWNTLKDPTKRRLYDAELMLTKLQAHSNIFARLTLADMKRCAASETTTTTSDGSDNGECGDKSESTGTEGNTYWYYTYDCRCGGQYIVDESVDSKMLNSNRDHNRAANDQRQNQTSEEQQIKPKQKSYDNGIDNPSSQAVVDSGAVQGSAAMCGSSENNKTTIDDEDILKAGAFDADDDGEVLVECSECSLVIVLT